MAAASGVSRIVAPSGIAVAVASDGSYGVTATLPAWRFSGNVGSRLSGIAPRAGGDRAGTFREIVFTYDAPDGGARAGSIRVYDKRPIGRFTLVFRTPGSTSEAFPSLSSYPPHLRHLSYAAVFGGYSFERFGSDGPWVFFDDQANAFIFSPASHYMNAALSFGPYNELTSKIAAGSERLPEGFVKTDVLVIETGINRAFEAWGRFLTDLAGKRRPPNDADVTLNSIGYWTDHGTQHYYKFEPGLGYAGTLLKIRDEFRAEHIRLGYVQLDSWFYPKGREGRWQDNEGGTYLYEASRDLFPKGLAAFQKKLGVPLITHNRWIDEASPYRKTYAISGNVPVDRRLWSGWMRWLRAAGVRMYEQDWLSGPAVPERNLTSGEAFMDAMADAAKRAGIVLQYSMPLPRHFLQGSHYSNLLTVRVSGDRFGKDHWEEFLFNGRLASALGEWPWSDAVSSAETSNLLLSVLSGASVGVGDSIGNLARAVRADGVIVKPDDAITPLDQAYLAAAGGRPSPLVAVAHSRHQGSVTTYLFAFPRSGAERTASVSPVALGYKSPVFAYDYFAGRGVYLRSSETFTFPVPDDGAYWVIVPVGASGVGFLGEAGKFVPNGKKRIASLRDNGTLTARILLAPGERRLRFRGYARARPRLSARPGIIENLAYDPHSGLFHFDLTASAPSVVTILAAARARRPERGGLKDAVLKSRAERTRSACHPERCSSTAPHSRNRAKALILAW